MSPVEKWVKALRGDAYIQAVGSLRDDLGFCALGVLFQENGYLSRDGKLCVRKGGRAVATRLEVVIVLQKLGVPLTLADRVNDRNEARETFPAIADYIERYLADE